MVPIPIPAASLSAGLLPGGSIIPSAISAPSSLTGLGYRPGWKTACRCPRITEVVRTVGDGTLQASAVSNNDEHHWWMDFCNQPMFWADNTGIWPTFSRMCGYSNAYPDRTKDIYGVEHPVPD